MYISGRARIFFCESILNVHTFSGEYDRWSLCAHVLIWGVRPFPYLPTRKSIFNLLLFLPPRPPQTGVRQLSNLSARKSNFNLLWFPPPRLLQTFIILCFYDVGFPPLGAQGALVCRVHFSIHSMLYTSWPGRQKGDPGVFGLHTSSMCPPSFYWFVFCVFRIELSCVQGSFLGQSFGCFPCYMVLIIIWSLKNSVRAWQLLMLRKGYCMFWGIFFTYAHLSSWPSKQGSAEARCSRSPPRPKAPVIFWNQKSNGDSVAFVTFGRDVSASRSTFLPTVWNAWIK